MLHNHKHEHCQHADLKFCQDCNVVFCRSCNKEWSNYSLTWGSTQTYRSPAWAINNLANNLTAKAADGLTAVNNSLEAAMAKTDHKHK